MWDRWARRQLRSPGILGVWDRWARRQLRNPGISGVWDRWARRQLRNPGILGVWDRWARRQLRNPGISGVAAGCGACVWGPGGRTLRSGACRWIPQPARHGICHLRIPPVSSCSRAPLSTTVPPATHQSIYGTCESGIRPGSGNRQSGICRLHPDPIHRSTPSITTSYRALNIAVHYSSTTHYASLLADVAA